ncbi:hypothetical protein CC79DRAFT_1337007 [Sarocladium strictum]
MSLFQRVVPLALAIFSGVVGGVYTFKPLFDPAERTSPEAYSIGAKAQMESSRSKEAEETQSSN